jgi:dihydropteroate synthase
MLVMGILNVTPDSFSDGGLFADHETALAQGLVMVSEGADIIDIGGESTRPGAIRVSEEEEIARVIPVITSLAAARAVISIDTMRSKVAQLAIEAGASYVNDVSGGLADPLMHEVVAQLGVPYILMHWRGHSIDMNSKAIYQDVVTEVIEELKIQIDHALAAGIARDKIIIDPGIGFAKLPEHNWELLNRVEELAVLGYPILVGASRKKFLGDEPDQREAATVEVTRGLVGRGIWAVRVHSVAANKKVLTHG